MRLVVFRVIPMEPSFPYLLSRVIPGSNKPPIIPNPSWGDAGSLDSASLTMKLNQQISYELDLARYQNNGLCQQGLDYRTMYPEVCRRWIESINARLNVNHIDHSALEQTNFNVVPFVVVAVENGLYYGHVFTWISPVNPDRCMMIGIRNRIDTLFLKQDRSKQYLSGIATFLLEGVRRFAAIKGCRRSALALSVRTPLECSRISVFEPLSPMRPILSGAGFSSNVLASFLDAGNGPGGPEKETGDRECDCPTHENVRLSFVDPDVALDFNLTEL